KRPNFLGGWVVLLIAAGAAYYFGKPLFQLQAQNTPPTSEHADVLIAALQPSAKPGERLAAAALQRTRFDITYEDAYYVIDYPNGDISSDKGRAEDLVVRSYRALGVDLQQRVHEDMRENFSEYPQIFGRKSADSNIDHRLTANLRRFFRRCGAELLVVNEEGFEVPSKNPEEYLPGDVVTWRLAEGNSHIGIVVPGPGEHRNKPWVVHNMGKGPIWEDCLRSFKITGHYRYEGTEAVDLGALLEES
ncbi:MAG: DUF1287 domain-containing protein, partial [Verrucomicrobiales bacterium]